MVERALIEHFDQRVRVLVLQPVAERAGDLALLLAGDFRFVVVADAGQGMDRRRDVVDRLHERADIRARCLRVSVLRALLVDVVHQLADAGRRFPSIFARADAILELGVALRERLGERADP
jgi:hypothetical protein